MLSMLVLWASLPHSAATDSLIEASSTIRGDTTHCALSLQDVPYAAICDEADRKGSHNPAPDIGSQKTLVQRTKCRLGRQSAV